jgi:hypothetical protein
VGHAPGRGHRCRLLRLGPFRMEHRTMNRTAHQAQVVPLPVRHRERTRLQLTRDLARAFAREQRAEALLRAARQEIDAAFGPWAAGRTIARDEARDQLISTGFLPHRRIWQ